MANYRFTCTPGQSRSAIIELLGSSFEIDPDQVTFEDHQLVIASDDALPAGEMQRAIAEIKPGGEDTYEPPEPEGEDDEDDDDDDGGGED